MVLITDELFADILWINHVNFTKFDLDKTNMLRNYDLVILLSIIAVFLPIKEMDE